MDTHEQFTRWHRQHDHIAEDQNPGCRTHASGFDYIMHYTAADKAIDELWQRELREARKELVGTLKKKLKKTL